MEEYFDRKGYYPKGVEVEGWKWRKNKHMVAPVVTKKHPPHLPICPIEDFEHSLVSCLIDPNTRQWQTDMVGDLFVEEDVEMIKKIPLSQLVTEDVLYWPFMSNGIYICSYQFNIL